MTSHTPYTIVSIGCHKASKKIPNERVTYSGNFRDADVTPINKNSNLIICYPLDQVSPKEDDVREVEVCDRYGAETMSISSSIVSEELLTARITTVCDASLGSSEISSTNEAETNIREDMNHRVRFKPGTSMAPKLTTKQKNMRKLVNKIHYGNSDSLSSLSLSSQKTCDSVRWWTNEELDVIRQSCESAVRQREDGTIEGDSSLDRFSVRNRKRRKLIRSKMYETTKAIQEYESATKTKVPDLLSEVLGIYSKPMERYAIKTALKMLQPGQYISKSRG